MKPSRPHFENIQSGSEFNQWYWLKAEMVEICKILNLPYSGGKFELRDRIIYALDNDGKLLDKPKVKKVTSKFNWAKEKLSLETIITDSVTFGKNFRGFMTAQIGNHFSCHSDFMDWVKANPGKTLQEAVLKWEELERRKEDPTFKREIAQHNMLSQYVRDFLEAHPELAFKDALAAWKLKKEMPMKDGFVKYEKGDDLLKVDEE